MPRVKRPTSNVYVAKRAFWCELDGETLFIKEGERVRDGHKLLQVQGEHFEPVDTGVVYDVEQATAAPGETRG